MEKNLRKIFLFELENAKVYLDRVLHGLYELTRLAHSPTGKKLIKELYQQSILQLEMLLPSMRISRHNLLGEGIETIIPQSLFNPEIFRESLHDIFSFYQSYNEGVLHVLALRVRKRLLLLVRYVLQEPLQTVD